MPIIVVLRIPIRTRLNVRKKAGLRRLSLSGRSATEHLPPMRIAISLLLTDRMWNCVDVCMLVDKHLLGKRTTCLIWVLVVMVGVFKICHQGLLSQVSYLMRVPDPEIERPNRIR
jgi:hypothetical protein